MASLSARLLLAVSLLLLVFFGATIVVLDSAFREAGEQAQEDILDGQLIALLAAADPNADGELVMPLVMQEPRLGTIGSVTSGSSMSAGVMTSQLSQSAYTCFDGWTCDWVHIGIAASNATTARHRLPFFFISRLPPQDDLALYR